MMNRLHFALTCLTPLAGNGEASGAALNNKLRDFVEAWNRWSGEYSTGVFNVPKTRELNRLFRRIQQDEGWPK